MILLYSILDTIEIYLDGAIATNELYFFCVYNDICSSPYGPCNARGQSDGATPVTISGDLLKEFARRAVNTISVRNKDTASRAVTFRINSDGVYTELGTYNLQPDDTINYESGRGWYVLDKFGAPKVNPATGGDLILMYPTGTGDYAATNPALGELSDGAQVSVKIPNNNIGAVTFNFGFGTNTAKNFVDTDFTADELEAGGWYDFQYNADLGFWLCKTPTDKIMNPV